MATFIFTASERFDRAVAEPGDNLTNLLQGLSAKKGLGRLFAQLSTLAWAVAASQARAWHPADGCMLVHVAQCTVRIAQRLVLIFLRWGKLLAVVRSVHVLLCWHDEMYFPFAHMLKVLILSGSGKCSGLRACCP